MEAYRQEIIVGSVVIYMLFCVATGLWAMRRTHDSSDFFVAGRGLGPIVVALALFSSTLSGFGFVGGPGLVYSIGVSSFWMVVISSTGYAVGFFLVAKRIRMIAELRDCLSLPDVVAARYGSDAVRFLIALTIVLGVMGYLATQILAMAVVMQAILSGTETFANIGLVSCVVISSAVLIFYCVTGGIIASVYTDVVQGFIMMIAGSLILMTAVSVFDGGMQEATAIILADDSEAIMPFGSAGVMASLGWFFVFGLGLAGQPHLITKMMMNKKMSDNRSILPMSLFGYVMAALLWISIGIVMRAAVIDGVVEPLALPDDAASTFLSIRCSRALSSPAYSPQSCRPRTRFSTSEPPPSSMTSPKHCADAASTTSYSGHGSSRFCLPSSQPASRSIPTTPMPHWWPCSAHSAGARLQPQYFRSWQWG
jgi:Na+/proline symporter